MRYRFLPPALGAALFIGLAGCGTMENLVTKEKGGPSVYGGVSADFKTCQGILKEEPPDGLHPGAKSLHSHSKAVRFCGRMIDMPLSTVGDTLTLPFALFGGSAAPAPTTRDVDAFDEEEE